MKDAGFVAGILMISGNKLNITKFNGIEHLNNFIYIFEKKND